MEPLGGQQLFVQNSVASTEIDLHGWTHDEVKNKLPNLLILCHNKGGSPIEIITGNSEKMKSIVRALCKKHGFDVDEKWNTNPGTVVIRERGIFNV